MDQESTTGQAVLYVARTIGFSVDDTIVINRDGDREEEKIILSIQADVSLTLTTNLTKTHTVAQADRVEKYSLVPKTEYNVETAENSPGRVKLRTGYNWPTHREFASFIVEFKAGYGDAASNVPGALIQATLQLIGHLYDNRGADEVPKDLKALFWPFKIMRI